VSDSEEETVDRHVVTLLIGLAHAFHHVHSFHAVFAVQPYGIVFEEHLDVGMA
jgi:hypothetical protein